ncbi:MAG: MscL family protein [Anaerolineae bacterium]|nr:MscL family protein [Anaerolineae bacterium]
MAAAKAAGAPTINYGVFITTVVHFFIIAVVLFLFVRQVNRWTAHPTAPAEPTTKTCPYCYQTIPRPATRCPHCTSVLTPTEP